jgi:hypothetical protein
MIGLNELIIPFLILAVVTIFGRKTVLKLYRDFKATKKDLKEIDKEYDKDEKK